MGLLRTAMRAVVLGGAAAGAAYYARQKGLIGGGAQLAAPEPPAPPPPAPEPAPAAEEEKPTAETAAVEPPPPAPVPEPRALEETAPEEAEVVTAEPRPADVTDVVDDLLGGTDSSVVDAEVVEGGDDDTSLARAVREAVADEAVEVEARGGTVFLRGEIDRPEAILEAERRAQGVEGVERVDNLLRLPGTPPPQRH